MHGIEVKLMSVDYVLDSKEVLWVHKVGTFEYFNEATPLPEVRGASFESDGDGDGANDSSDWALLAGANGKLGPLLATTELTEPAAMGATALQVKSTEGFRVDMQLLVGVGATSEYRYQIPFPASDLCFFFFL